MLHPKTVSAAEVSMELDTFVSQLRKTGVSYSQAVYSFRKQFLLTVLTRYRGNQCAVANALGVHRNTIKRQLDELGIDPLQARPENMRRIRG